MNTQPSTTKMQTLESNYRQLARIDFPEYKGRQIYMHSFNTGRPNMPEGFEDYLEPVMRLVSSAGLGAIDVHVTIDEKVVSPGMSQRRPGPHVDGCFTGSAWGHGGGGGGGRWNHNCNEIPALKRMAIIVAASVSGCKAWAGTFFGDPQNDGDCSHIVSGEGEVLPANVGYLLSPDCIHESMVFPETTQRQFLRIAFAV
jgi:hypothetical protein